MDAFRLDGKTALVTGASRGIGRECCTRLVAAGAYVIAVARSEEELRSLENEGGECICAWVMDVTDPHFYDRIEKLDRLDILVNNVGTNKPQPFPAVEESALDSMIAINIRSAFKTAQAASRVMLRNQSGSIIHISSQMGHVGAVNRTVYCMTKHAIEGLGKAMAIELAPRGVRVNTVAPTFIETPLTKPMLDNPEFRESVLNSIPLGHLGSVADVAHAVTYLASDAASMVTGTSLKVDGGWTAR